MRYIKESENIDLPFIPGSEFSGEIIEVNDKQLSRFKPGDQVMVILGRNIIFVENIGYIYTKI